MKKNLYETSEKNRKMLDSLLPKCLKRNGTLNLRTDRTTLTLLSELIKGVSDASEYPDEVLMKEVARISALPNWIYFGRQKKSRAFYFFKMQRLSDKGGCYVLEPSARLTYQSQPIICETIRELVGGNTEYMFPGAVQQLILSEQDFLGHRGDKRDVGYYFRQREFDGSITFRDKICRLLVDENNPDRLESGTGTSECNYTGIAVRMAKIIQNWVDEGKMKKTAIPWTLPPKIRKDEPLQEIVLGEMRISGIS